MAQKILKTAKRKVAPTRAEGFKVTNCDLKLEKMRMSSDIVLRKDDSFIASRIRTIRGVQVILDWDIAELYGVETRVLNQAVKRNAARFPERFRFLLTKSELSELITNCDKFGNKKHYPGTPAAFTEQGVAMLSAVLRSQTAVDVSIRIMDAFVAMRRFIVTNAAVLQRLGAVEMKQIAMDEKLNKVLGKIDGCASVMGA